MLEKIIIIRCILLADVGHYFMEKEGYYWWWRWYIVHNTLLGLLGTHAITDALGDSDV